MKTVRVSKHLIAALVDAAQTSNHHHLEHATWDTDGSPCYRCQCVDEARAIVGYPCNSCFACDAARETQHKQDGVS